MKAKMKTIVILEHCGEEPLRFYVFEADYRHWNHAVVNSVDINPKLQDEIIEVLYGPDDDKEWLAPEYFEDFPLGAITPETVVVVVTYLP